MPNGALRAALLRWGTALCFLVPLRLVAQDSLVVNELRRGSLELSLAADTLGGPAAAFLANEARHNQFILIGESHGFAEVPAFAAALFHLAKPAGYKHLAVEIGARSAATIDSLARSPQPAKAFGGFYDRFPFSVAFYYWREEEEMAERAVREMPLEGNVIWGLDQELMFSSTFLFDQIAVSASTADARRTARELATRSALLDRQMLTQHNPLVVYMMSTTDAGLDTVTRRLVTGSSDPAEGILGDLRLSRRIYKEFLSGNGFASNTDRAALVLRNFWNYYNRSLVAGEKLPKVLIKFGIDHVMKGRTITDVYDIGSLTNELATANGSGALNILTVVANGNQNAWLPFAGTEATKQRPFRAATDPANELTQLGVDAILDAAGAASAWTLFDLRPLRAGISARRYGRLSVGLERLIWAYDICLVIPNAHASHLYNDMR